MSDPSSQPRALDRASIDVGPAYAIWSVGWVVGALVATPVAILAVGAELGDDLSIGQLGVVLVATWAVMLAALYVGSRKFGTGDVVRDYAVSFRAKDLVGVPIGLAAQWPLLALVYLPLRSVWPDTFATDELEDRARTLVDSADGAWVALLIVLLVVGAPVVEELAYRGLLLRSTVGSIGAGPALVAVSVLFSLIHFSPVEYPGLFVAGLVFGGCYLWTRRLGTAIIAHASFNLLGVITVLRAE